MSVVIKIKPADSASPPASATVPSSWGSVSYKYVDNSTPRDLGLILSSVASSSFIVGIESDVSLNITTAQQIKGLVNSSVIIGTTRSVGDDPFEFPTQPLAIDPYLKNQTGLAGLSPLEFTCELYTRLHALEPTLSPAQLVGWVSDYVLNGTLTLELFNNFPPYPRTNIPPVPSGTVRYRLFAPTTEGQKIDFDLEFFSRSQKKLSNIKASETELGNFAQVNGQKLAINLQKNLMSQISGQSVFSNSLTVFEVVQGDEKRVEQDLRFDVSFVDSVSIEGPGFLGAPLFPGVKNKQLLGKIKFAGDSKYYNFNDPSVSARLGLSGNVLSWSTSGNLVSVSPSGLVTVPENNILPAAATIGEFYKYISDPTLVKTQAVTLTLNANYVAPTVVTLKVSPSLKWYPLGTLGSDNSDLIKSLNSFNATLSSAETTLKQATSVLTQIKRIVPVLGLFESFQVPNVLSILAGPVIDTLISILNTGIYYTTFNPLNDSDLRDKGKLTDAALQAKEKRVTATLNKLLDPSKSGFLVLGNTLQTVGSDVLSTLGSATTEASKFWSRAFSAKNWNQSVSFPLTELDAWNSVVKSQDYNLFFYEHPASTVPEGALYSFSKGEKVLLNQDSPIVKFLNQFGVGIAYLPKDSSGIRYTAGQAVLNESQINNNLRQFYASVNTYILSKIPTSQPNGITATSSIESILQATSGDISQSALLDWSKFKIEEVYVNKPGNLFLRQRALNKGDFSLDEALRNRLIPPKK